MQRIPQWSWNCLKLAQTLTYRELTVRNSCVGRVVINGIQSTRHTVNSSHPKIAKNGVTSWPSCIAALWRVDFVTSWPCDEMTVWRLGRVTSWPCILTAVWIMLLISCCKKFIIPLVVGPRYIFYPHRSAICLFLMFTMVCRLSVCLVISSSSRGFSSWM